MLFNGETDMIDKVLPVFGALTWATLHTSGSVLMGFLFAPPRSGNLIDVSLGEVQAMALCAIGVFSLAQAMTRLDGWMSSERPKYVSFEVFLCVVMPAIAWALSSIQPVGAILLLFLASLTSVYLDFSRLVAMKREE